MLVTHMSIASTIGHNTIHMNFSQLLFHIGRTLYHLDSRLCDWRTSFVLKFEELLNVWSYTIDRLLELGLIIIRISIVQVYFS